MGIFDGLPTIFTGTFGQAVTIPASGGGTIEITAIVRNEEMGADVFGDTGVVRWERAVHARTADVDHVEYGDTITIDGTDYLAEAPTDMRNGMTRIGLRAT